GGRGGGAPRGARRALPSVDALLSALAGHPSVAALPRRRVTEAAREALAAERRRLLEVGGPPPDTARLAERVAAALAQGGAFSLAPVVNATRPGLHPNLAR